MQVGENGNKTILPPYLGPSTDAFHAQDAIHFTNHIQQNVQFSPESQDQRVSWNSTSRCLPQHWAIEVSKDKLSVPHQAADSIYATSVGVSTYIPSLDMPQARVACVSRVDSPTPDNYPTVANGGPPLHSLFSTGSSRDSVDAEQARIMGAPFIRESLVRSAQGITAQEEIHSLKPFCANDSTRAQSPLRRPPKVVGSFRADKISQSRRKLSDNQRLFTCEHCHKDFTRRKNLTSMSSTSLLRLHLHD
jgi:hypothetical protein